MIQINDTWAIDSDGNCWIIKSRTTKEESAKARASFGHKGEPAERAWKNIAYHRNLSECATALLERMELDAGQKASSVGELVTLVQYAKAEIVAAVKETAPP